LSRPLDLIVLSRPFNEINITGVCNSLIMYKY
jgi:hypothetical protein